MDSVRKILEDAVKKIVPHPDEVTVSYVVGSKTVVFKVDCTQRNFAFLLGAKGRTIDALRVLANVMTSKGHGMRAVIEVPFFKSEKQAEGVKGSEEPS